MGEAEDKTGDAGMFAIFIFSVVALGVIPMTIWRVSTGGGAKVQVVQPWRKVRCALELAAPGQPAKRSSNGEPHFGPSARLARTAEAA